MAQAAQTQTAAFPFGTPRGTASAAQTMTAAAATMTRGGGTGGLLPSMPTNLTMDEQIRDMAEERYRLMQARYQDQINAFHQQQEREREERRKQESYLTHQRDQLLSELQTSERLRKEEQSRRQQWETQAADNLARVTQYQQELDRRGEQFAAATQQLRDEATRRVEEQRQLLAEQRRAHEEAMAIARQTGQVGADAQDQKSLQLQQRHTQQLEELQRRLDAQLAGATRGMQLTHQQLLPQGQQRQIFPGQPSPIPWPQLRHVQPASLCGGGGLCMNQQPMPMQGLQTPQPLLHFDQRMQLPVLPQPQPQYPVPAALGGCCGLHGGGPVSYTHLTLPTSDLV